MFTILHYFILALHSFLLISQFNKPCLEILKCETNSKKRQASVKTGQEFWLSNLSLSFKWQKQIDIILARGRSLTSQIWKTVSCIIIYTFQPRAEQQTSNVSRIISRVIWKCILFHLAKWTEVVYSGYYQTTKTKWKQVINVNFYLFSSISAIHALEKSAR